jgi:hypothetical protein
MKYFFGLLTFFRAMHIFEAYHQRFMQNSFLRSRVIVRGLSDITIPQKFPQYTKLYNVPQRKDRDGLGKPKGYSDVKSRYVLQRHTLSGLPNDEKPFLVLGIESSCDDTGAAIVRSDGVVLSNVVYSQYEIHEKFGGIVPSLAMEAHKGNIEKAVQEAVQQAGLAGLHEVDLCMCIYISMYVHMYVCIYV